MILLRSANGPLSDRDLRRVCVYPSVQLTEFVLVFLLAIGSMLPTSGQAQQTNNGQNKIHGTVVNAVTRQPIGRALVYSPDDRFGTLTDGEGNFEFNLPKVENNGSG